jgi:hypothetical protein
MRDAKLARQHSPQRSETHVLDMPQDIDSQIRALLEERCHLHPPKGLLSNKPVSDLDALPMGHHLACSQDSYTSTRGD